jgi:hypothetical protein
MRPIRPRLSMRLLMALVVGFALAFWTMTLFPRYPHPFGAYPRSPAMDDNIRWQMSLLGQDGSRGPSLRLLTFPTGSPRLAAQLEVRAPGEVERAANISRWARQSRRGRRLTDGEMDWMREAGAGLPASDGPPPLERLLVVGFNAGPGWTIRIYDRARLAPEVSRLCEFVGFEDLGDREARQAWPPARSPAGGPRY